MRDGRVGEHDPPRTVRGWTTNGPAGRHNAACQQETKKSPQAGRISGRSRGFWA